MLLVPEAERQRIYVKYEGGSTPGTVRAVLPLQWSSEPTAVVVRCFKDEANPSEKTYFVSRMAKVSLEYFRE